MLPLCKTALLATPVGVPKKVAAAIGFAANFVAGAAGNAAEQKIVKGSVDKREVFTTGLSNAASGLIYGNEALKNAKDAFGKGALSGAVQAGIRNIVETGRDTNDYEWSNHKCNEDCLVGSSSGYVSHSYQNPRPSSWDFMGFVKDVTIGGITGGIEGLGFYGGGKAFDKIADGIKETYKNAYDRIQNASLWRKYSSSPDKTINNFSDDAIVHAYLGEFTYDPRTRQINNMKSGGYGQVNIDLLDSIGKDYTIVKIYKNGVRVGYVPNHKTPRKRSGIGQSWFPESWDANTIRDAGNYVIWVNKLKGIVVPDGKPYFATYKGVRVGVIDTSSIPSTIFPDSIQPEYFLFIFSHNND